MQALRYILSVVAVVAAALTVAQASPVPVSPPARAYMRIPTREPPCSPCPTGARRAPRPLHHRRRLV
ncbi:hypothetical protein OH77DRAFT_1422407, partial [Trametes cingulata]